jgi:hypothetical protein
LVVQVNAYGSDIWEMAARRGLDMLEAALECSSGGAPPN